ncbi:hypothetical protein [Nocardia sp. NPDC024068]|uniref:hypothetical protein n=1 Tax=Nocardia sp. NPDC024068 TaxID=3157197 RepID=UPI0033D674CD
MFLRAKIVAITSKSYTNVGHSIIDIALCSMYKKPFPERVMDTNFSKSRVEIVVAINRFGSGCGEAAAANVTAPHFLPGSGVGKRGRADPEFRAEDMRASRSGG